MNATDIEFRDYVAKELNNLKKEVDGKVNKEWARIKEISLDNIFERLSKVEKALENVENRVACVVASLPNPSYEEETKNDTNALIDEYLTLYDAILSKVSDKYKTLDIRLKKDIATTIFIRLMQK